MMYLDKGIRVFHEKETSLKWGFSETRATIMINTMFEPPTVAPRAGAWIETLVVHLVGTRSNVAPRAGAWIETPP